MSSMDLSPFAEAASDQLTADDLMGGPRTIKITRVVGDEDTKRVSIYFEGDGGKPFRPCKTVVRVLMALWGKYASEYAGRSVTLYRDPDVEFGGLATGGIRISHASHITETTKVVVMKTRGKKVPLSVKPLEVAPQADPPKPRQTPEEWTDGYIAKVAACEKIEDLMALQSDSAKALAKLQADKPELHECATNAGAKRAGELQAAEPVQETFDA